MWRKVISLLIGLTIIAFLLSYVWKYWDTLRATHLVLRLDMVFLSFFLGLISFVIYSIAWYVLIQSENSSIRFVESNYMLAKGNLGKYIPGRVWQFVGRLYFFSNMGFPRGKIVMIAILEQYLLLVSAFVIFVTCFLASPGLFEAFHTPNLRYILTVGLIVGLVSLHPKNILFWTRLLAKFTHKPFFEVSLPFRRLLTVISLYLIYWMITGLSLLFLARGGVSIPSNFILYIAGVNAIAYVVGYLSLVTPNGLGIREGILSYLLETVLFKGFGAMLSIASRLMLIACEIGYYFIAFVLYRFRERQIALTRRKIEKEVVIAP